jgi:hypothetical protein
LRCGMLDGENYTLSKQCLIFLLYKTKNITPIKGMIIIDKRMPITANPKQLSAHLVPFGRDCIDTVVAATDNIIPIIKLTKVLAPISNLLLYRSLLMQKIICVAGATKININANQFKNISTSSNFLLILITTKSNP